VFWWRFTAPPQVFIGKFRSSNTLARFGLSTGTGLLFVSNGCYSVISGRERPASARVVPFANGCSRHVVTLTIFRER